MVPERELDAVREPLTLRVGESVCEGVTLSDALPDDVELPERE